MKRALPLAFVLLLGVTARAQAQTVTPRYPEGTPVSVVRRITSPPKGELNEHKMQVAVGPDNTDITLHFKDAEVIGLKGDRIDEDGLNDGQWVRAEGVVMNDPRRIKVTRLRVIAPDRAALARSEFARSGFESGYVVDIAPPPLSATPIFPTGTRVAVVGEVTSQPKPSESKMQVAIGPERTDFTLHMKGAPLFGLDGRKIEENDIKDKMWVRAEGTVMEDERRIKVDRLQVIAPDHGGVARSAFYRPGLGYGYVSAVAGSRQTFPVLAEPALIVGPVTLVGRVAEDTGPGDTRRKVEIEAAGTRWTAVVPRDASVIDERGKKISVHEVHRGQWVRVTGIQTGDARLRVLRMDNIGPEETFRTSRYYRTEYPLGYFDREIEGRTIFDATTFSGRVTRIEPDFGYIVVRDGAGNLHRVYVDEAFISSPSGAAMTITEIRVGDDVDVRGRIIP